MGFEPFGGLETWRRFHLDPRLSVKLMLCSEVDYPDTLEVTLYLGRHRIDTRSQYPFFREELDETVARLRAEMTREHADRIAYLRAHPWELRIDTD